jgi:hypothetical protein
LFLQIYFHQRGSFFDQFLSEFPVNPALEAAMLVAITPAVSKDGLPSSKQHQTADPFA